MSFAKLRVACCGGGCLPNRLPLAYKYPGEATWGGVMSFLDGYKLRAAYMAGPTADGSCGCEWTIAPFPDGPPFTGLSVYKSFVDLDQFLMLVTAEFHYETRVIIYAHEYTAWAHDCTEWINMPLLSQSGPADYTPPGVISLEPWTFADD